MATITTPVAPISSGSEQHLSRPRESRPHLAFLDGLRGLTAFYVLVHHVYTHITSHDPPQLWGLAAYLLRWLGDGGLAVSVFIVLSGYCLMLPAASDASRSLSRTRFLRRRAMRILPPYYAALALSLLFIALLPIMQPHTDSPWDNAVPAFTTGRLISHLFLVHNANVDWLHAIDPPMWSIAIEWQIYFIFIFLLYPVWRRLGIVASVIIAFAVGLLPPTLGWPFSEHFWYVGLFATGMLGAVVTAPTASVPHASAVPLPTAGECGLIWALLLVMVVTTPLGNYYAADGSASTDVLLGILTTVTIVAMAREVRDGTEKHRSPLLRILESPALVQLGAFSYSLYLVHFPIVSFCDRVLSPRVHSYRFPIAMFAVAVPLSLVISYVFHLAFERPFMRRL
jgi:peptidoglycan/LPS O-acetylase OafA/YrhL